MIPLLPDGFALRHLEECDAAERPAVDSLEREQRRPFGGLSIFASMSPAPHALPAPHSLFHHHHLHQHPEQPPEPHKQRVWRLPFFRSRRNDEDRHHSEQPLQQISPSTSQQRALRLLPLLPPRADVVPGLLPVQQQQQPRDNHAGVLVAATPSRLAEARGRRLARKFRRRAHSARRNAVAGALSGMAVSTVLHPGPCALRASGTLFLHTAMICSVSALRCRSALAALAHGIDRCIGRQICVSPSSSTDLGRVLWTGHSGHPEDPGAISAEPQVRC
eukprot:scaffold1707_cov357-Prasinococcus_capsulatus_cf.AAC.10